MLTKLAILLIGEIEYSMEISAEQRAFRGMVSADALFYRTYFCQPIYCNKQ